MRGECEFVLTRSLVYCIICSTYLYRDVDVCAGQLACQHKYHQGTNIAIAIGPTLSASATAVCSLAPCEIGFKVFY